MSKVHYRRLTYPGVEVWQIPCLSDNYAYLISDRKSGKTAAIDAPDADAILALLAEEGLTLDYLLNTHHHADHVGGNLALQQETGCTIVGFAGDHARLPGISMMLQDGAVFPLGNSLVTLVYTPGHTLGHVVYYFAQSSLAFVGDTLFAMGCGRLFEGSPDVMWQSLKRIMAWPESTALFCAHEYTLKNARFALGVDPHNAALQERFHCVQQLVAKSVPTVPMTLGEEYATNPFLRADNKAIKATLGMADAEALAVFTELRTRRDQF